MTVRSIINATDYILRRRLWNWGRYCRTDNGGPDGSCANPLYNMMVYRDDDGFGEVTEETVVIPQDVAPRPELEEIDEADALVIDRYVLRMDAKPRAVLCVRYVLALPPKTPDAKDRLNVAIWSLQGLMTERDVACG